MTRRLFAASCVLFAAVLLVGFALAPGRMPLHFGPGLDADRVGSAERWLVETGLLGMALALLFGTMPLWLRRVPVRHLNVPDKDYWADPAHTPTLRAMLDRDLWGLGAAVMTLMAAVTALSVLAAHQDMRLSWLFFPVLGVFVVGVVGWSLVATRRRYAAPAGDRPEAPR